MKIRKFLQAIAQLKPTKEELEARGIPLSAQDDWEIDVLDDEFDMYDGAYYQMVSCLDTLSLFPGLEQLKEIDEDAPDPFLIWGYNSYYSFHYAFNYITDEAVLLDDLKSAEPAEYVAASNARLLDCLYIVAQFSKLRLLDPEKAELEKDAWITKAAEAAGGEKYLSHYQILIG